jgi:hypothetical protein
VEYKRDEWKGRGGDVGASQQVAGIGGGGLREC